MAPKSPLEITLDSIQDAVSDTKANFELQKNELKNTVSRKSLTLCIGSGVTSQLVGEWNTLLNEIASGIFFNKILEQCKEEKTYSFGKIRLIGTDVHDFLNNLWEGFPGNISVLEKGEYLAAQCDRSLKDKNIIQQFYDSSDKGPHWRELVFAEITLDVSRRLIAENIEKGEKKKDPSKDAKIDLPKLEEHLVDFYLDMVNERDKILAEGKKVGSDSPFKMIESLEAVVNLCFSGKISHIINYNFDTILEVLLFSDKVYEYYKSKGGIPLQLEVYNPFGDHEKPVSLFVQNTDSTMCHTIRIDHVHGLLDARLPEISPIVFSEESYINVRRTALHWSSLAIAKAVTEGSILCIGFSGEDDDFRTICQRMMDNNGFGYSRMDSSTKSISSHIFLVASLNSRIGKLKNPLKEKINQRNRPVGTEPQVSEKEKACIYELFDSYVDMVERYFKDHLNVQIVWIKDRPDIPALLQELITEG